jgi:sortase A
VLRGVGQTLITLGLVVLLFVVYEVWVSNIFSRQANDRLAHRLETEWARGDNPILPLPGQHVPTIALGAGIANLYVPRFGPDYHWTILQGTTQAVLADGPGHYVGTAMPGRLGNFAVAGHRVGKGEPFLNLDHLRAGDAVIVETESYWFVYRVKGLDRGLSQPDRDGIPGREIVRPDDGAVLLPVPDHPGRRPTERLMTLTTCHPKFTASQRMIVHAALVGRPIAVAQRDGHRAARMPRSVRRLYGQVAA